MSMLERTIQQVTTIDGHISEELMLRLVLRTGDVTEYTGPLFQVFDDDSEPDEVNTPVVEAELMSVEELECCRDFFIACIDSAKAAEAEFE